MRRHGDALVAYEGARAIAPDHPDADGLISAALAVCDWARTAPLTADLYARIEAGWPFTPFALLGLCDDPGAESQIAPPATPPTGYRRRLPGGTTTDMTAIRLAYLVWGHFGHGSWTAAWILVSNATDRGG